jgi:A/G-specific adenine glycosylase
MARDVLKFHKEWPALKRWYRRGARDLPWRRAPVDPYRIWIAEVMSQQSTLKSVVPYFQKWMSVFPDLDSLAKAKTEEVLKQWAGLGYYSRARNLHTAAQELKKFRDAHNNLWPQSPEEWMQLKGVGPYTAAAVTSIAFHYKIVPIDGNVLRVASRFWGVPDPLNSSKDRRLIETLLKDVPTAVSSKDMPILAQSLMELGALVCRPAAGALCDLCPLEASCEARRLKKHSVWPKAKARPKIEEKYLVASLWGLREGLVYLRQIPKGERLEGQWEWPLKEVSRPDFEKILKESDVIGPVSHAITKYRFKVLGEIPKAKGPPQSLQKKLGLRREFLDSKSLEALHLSTLTRKLLRHWERHRSRHPLRYP